VGIPHSVTKTLAAASATAIAASQTPGAGAILINGTASNRVSTTTTAATAAGIQGVSNILALTTVAGIVAGSAITDSTAAVIPAGTTVVGVDTVNSKVILSQPVGGAGVGSGDTIVIGGVATLDTQRRVNIPSNGSDNSGITFTVFGAGDNGVPISDTFAGPGVTNAVISNLDFKTITNITHTGTVTGAITIGTTSGAGLPANPLPAASTPWFGVNWHAQPFNIELAGIIGTGVTCNWSWQYTYDDPNNLPAGVLFPQPFNHPTLNTQAGSLDGSINDPVAAIRLVVNSGSGVRGTWMEAGISGQ
jgi:hypothetical protein